MSERRARSIAASWCLLAVAGGVFAAGGDDPATLELTGVVRDFQRAHPDFGVVPEQGYGHDAGNLAPNLGEDGRPVYTGNGYRVAGQWTDRLGRPLAPHLYRDGSLVEVATAPSVAPGATVDTFDSTEGPYGSGDIGPAPTFAVGAPMPVVSVPQGFGEPVDQLRFETPATLAGPQMIHCRIFDLNDTTLTVEGVVIIRCDERFRIHGEDAELVLAEGARLVVYALNRAWIDSDAAVNMASADPSRMVLYHLGPEMIRLWHASEVYGTIVAPDAVLNMNGDAQFHGRFTGRGLVLSEGNGFHLDTTMFDGCGVPIDDAPGALGAPSAGGITSPDTFAQWHADLPGLNLSNACTITLTEDGAGGYSFMTDEFHPIDDQLLGNEGEAHNYYFTYTIDAHFTYDACGNQFFAFEGDDDLWVFIDGRLALDLGGIQPRTPQFVSLDRLGLTDGQNYQFLIVYAQRQEDAAAFNIKTNIALRTGNGLSISGMVD